MQQPHYHWKRYWYPAADGYHPPLVENGYLSPPVQKYAHLVQSPGRTLLDLAKAGCVVLLGEPGIGKTRELECLERELSVEKHEAVLRIELGKKPTEQLLRNAISRAPEYRSWLQGSHHLHLLLDGLDEWLDSSIPFYLVLDVLPKEQIARLSLYITCRPNAWLRSFEEGLQRVWETMGIYQLAPLSREDVAEAAHAQGFNVTHFLQEVARHDLVPLAARPLTLTILLASYRQRQAFPSTLTQLYLESCQALCEECNDRHRSRRKRKLDAEARLQIAARIATLSTFTARPTIWIGSIHVDEARPDLRMRDMWGNAEQVRGQAFDITEASIGETLDTGLFSLRDSERLGWIHVSYADFLAAYYLWINHIPAVQSLELLYQYIDGERRVVPQLLETAAWLATMQPEVFRALVETEPEIIVHGDVARLSEKERAVLVDALFRIGPTRLGQLHFTSRHLYHRFAHPTLSTQLHSVLSIADLPVATRTVAIAIAEACGLENLQGDLLAIAFDQSQLGPVREDAVQALTTLGDKETRKRLLSLTALASDQDPNDEIKGHILTALWPDEMSAQELFSALTPIRNERFSGAYHRFLCSPFVEHLQSQDLPVALAWIEGLPARDLPTLRGDVLFAIADQVMLHAFRRLDHPETCDACARVVVSRIIAFDARVCGNADEARALLDASGESRQRLLVRVLGMLSDQINWAGHLQYLKPSLFHAQDLPWLLSHLARSAPETFQREMALLIHLLIQRYALDRTEEIDAACQSHPFFEEEMAKLLAAQEQERAERQTTTSQASEEHRVPKSAREEHFSEVLSKSNDAVECWLRFWNEAVSAAGGSIYDRHFDRTVFPGWESAGQVLRDQILHAGKRYLEDYDPQAQEWLASNRLPYAVWVAYKTLQLLVQEDPAWLTSLSRERWCRLLPVVLTMGEPTTTESDRALIALAQSVVPKEVAQATLLVIESEERFFHALHIVEKMSQFFDEALERVLLTKMQDPAISSDGLHGFFRVLLSRGVKQAVDFAYELIKQVRRGGEESHERATVAGYSLLFYTEHPRWEPIWDALRENESFGRRLVVKIAHGGFGWAPPFLKEEELVDLYLWLIQHYPPAQHPLPEIGGFVGVVDSIALWRDNLIQQLRSRGTPTAAAALARIIRERPDVADQLNLHWVLLDTQRQAARGLWQPFTPKDLLALFYDQKARLVQSGGHLLEVVIESLADLERSFGDETPAWRDVWDPVLPVVCSTCTTKIVPERRLYRPLEEEEVSDYLKRYLDTYLKARGIIANREVQISRGERTDIHISATCRDQRGDVYDRVTVIIEVKGCWNDEWDTAMEEQLVNRYLSGNSCRDGLYLVAWFMCEHWDSKGDYRYARTPSLSLDEVRVRLDAQASAMSSREGLNVKALVLDARVKRQVGAKIVESSEKAEKKGKKARSTRVDRAGSRPKKKGS
ncbi:hypothetical protein KSD_42390 [Ktedonobacter sp. SOSP1-85]|uniref:NACHT domain-containing protein n=1 Tax=Ktedonobacter sp. SOSP1-85 TaxID=2778367 RepID=UPI001915375B|nr:hypothetical protein [Ktedonobacter sp. SOSP1-85]GHO76468.1 hypothetical protein KSD_42390 [Ktedonobacter sp. SOSP1-85]